MMPKPRKLTKEQRAWLAELKKRPPTEPACIGRAGIRGKCGLPHCPRCHPSPDEAVAQASNTGSAEDS